jgi:hypothetical protein
VYGLVEKQVYLMGVYGTTHDAHVPARVHARNAAVQEKMLHVANRQHGIAAGFR